MLRVPSNLYMFRNTKTNKHLGVYRNDTLHVVGVPHLDYAQHVLQTANLYKHCELFAEPDRPVSFGLVYFSKPYAPVKKNKIGKIPLNNDFVLEEISTNTFTTMPMSSKIGIVIGLDMAIDSETEICFSTLIVNANQYFEFESVLSVT
jgi:hypothetical protein